MTRLIIDMARRRWRFGALLFVTIAGGWWMWWALGLAKTDDLRLPFGYSMGMAFGLGAQMTLLYMPRAIWYLPVSRRDAWRAGWIVSTVAVTLLTTAAKLVAVAMAGPHLEGGGIAAVALSSLYDLGFCGMGCALASTVTRPHPSRAPWRQLSNAMAGLAVVAMPLGMVVGMQGASLFPGAIATHWTNLTPLTAGALVGALGLTVASYFHAPVPARATPADGGVRAGAASRHAGRRGVSGMRRLLVHEYAWTLGVSAGLGLGSMAFVLVAAHVRSPEELAALLRLELQRFDGVMPPPLEGADPFMVLVLLGCFAGTIAARYPSMMRHLRVLPFGTARLQALLVAWPAAIWLNGWVAFIALHYLFVRQGVTSLHVPAFIGLAGISALVVALSLRLSGPQHGVAFGSLILFVPMLLFVGFPPAWMSACGGVLGFIAAVALNRSALRRSATYRHSGMPVALPLTR